MNFLPEFLSPIGFKTLLLGISAALLVLALLRLAAGPPAANSRRWGLCVLRGAILALLALLLANPVRVDEQGGTIERPEVFCLLDASQSMSMGTSGTRFDEAVNVIREAQNLTDAAARARLGLFTFGQKLSAVEPSQIGLASASPDDEKESAINRSAPRKPLARVGPVDSDTQLAGALRQLSSRFGRAPPAAIVLLSDGQARDAADAGKVAADFRQLQAPIHVVPVGDTGKGGDVAIVGVVAPDRVRRFSQVDVQVFLRSYGYDGRRAELAVSAVGGDARPPRRLATLPIVLKRGIQSAALTFQSDANTRKLEITVTPQPDETSSDNNRFATEIAIDRTKIRVLYIEGNLQTSQRVVRNNRAELRGPFSDLQDALSEDPDVECIVLVGLPGSTEFRRLVNGSADVVNRGFPDTVAELSAFDCIIFSNVGQNSIADKHLRWIETWVANRGGGVCMVGGQYSFASGGWRGTLLEQMLPIEMLEADDDWNPTDQIAVQPLLTGGMHPIWHVVSDDQQNREIVRSFPPFSAGNRLPRAKPNVATVLATANVGQGDPVPVLAVGQYGKGRSLALAGAITDPWAVDFLKWGQNDRRYYAKFWRNAVYWLTENSSIGRRRLIAGADKKFYRPGETIALAALAYDEGANRTDDYRIVAMIEPAGAAAEMMSDYSPVRWPDGLPRTSGEEGPFIAWGEEFELARGSGKEGYDLALPVAEALSGAAAAQALRIELTAYEDQTQVDSTSLNLQVLDDPFELQNPFPNHELLARVALESWGTVLRDAAALSKLLGDLPIRVGPPSIRKTPLWSRWWLVAVLVGLLTVEWIWRRGIGLA
ncbi:MAG: hypothetical protein EXS05_09265 [Planctomycetaceae bacterium]|nr:hypothetical protein [Planctomycetaceae bacterium]